MKNKIDLGAGVASYPMPVVLVGAIVKGKPNFLANGFFVNAGYKPPKVAAVLNKAHYTNQGARAWANLKVKPSVWAKTSRLINETS